MNRSLHVDLESARQQLREHRLAELRAPIAEGVSQADRGEVAPLDIQAITAKARLSRKNRR